MCGLPLAKDLPADAEQACVTTATRRGGTRQELLVPIKTDNQNPAAPRRASAPEQHPRAVPVLPPQQ